MRPPLSFPKINQKNNREISGPAKDNSAPPSVNSPRQSASSRKLGRKSCSQFSGVRSRAKRSSFKQSKSHAQIYPCTIKICPTRKSNPIGNPPRRPCTPHSSGSSVPVATNGPHVRGEASILSPPDRGPFVAGNRRCQTGPATRRLAHPLQSATARTR